LALPFGQNFAPFGFAELAIASPDLKYELLCALGSGLPSRCEFEKFALKMLIFSQKDLMALIA
jgi:hypothetical protein